MIKSKPNKTPEDKKQLDKLKKSMDRERQKAEFGGENHSINAKELDMKKYTFIFEYKGGTYIKQLIATELKSAIDNWGELIGSDIPKFNKKKKKQLLNEIQMNTPVLLSGMENVWYLHLSVGKSFGHLNIVATL